MKALLKYGRLPDFEAVVRRFPVPVLVAAAFAIWLAINGFELVDDRQGGIFGGFILAFFVSTIMKLAAESRNRVGIVVTALAIMAAIASVALMAHWAELAIIVVLAILAALAWLGNSAFSGRPRDDSAVWVFTQRIWTGAAFATLGSIIFTLGTMAIYAALDTLFGLGIDQLVEHVILPLGLAFLAPVYWLGTVPGVRDFDDGECGDLTFEARAVRFIGGWLLTPLTLIYGLIILAYALRILVTWELPKGEIAALVTPFIAVGTVTWLIMEPSVWQAGRATRLFRRLWFPIAIVATLLVAIAVGVRISEYGLTLSRNLLVIFVVAALTLGVWFTLRPRDDIRIPTAVTAGFALMSAFLAKPVADLDQRSRLLEAIEAADGPAVHSSAKYLMTNDRSDWVLDAFPDGPDPATRWSFDNQDGWGDYLVAQGFARADRDPDERVRRNFIQSEEPIILTETPILFDTDYDIRILGPDSSSSMSERGDVDRATWKDGRFTLVLDGDAFGLTLDDPFDPVAIFRKEDTLSTSHWQDTQGRAPVLRGRLSDGRRVLIYPRSLRLSGRGTNFEIGHGTAMLFLGEQLGPAREIP